MRIQSQTLAGLSSPAVPSTLRSFYHEIFSGTSLVIQWLRHCASTAGGTGLIPGWGTKILHAAHVG